MFPDKGWKLAAESWGDKKERMKDAKGGIMVGILVWNEKTYEGEVILSPAVLDNDWLTKADMLGDFKGLLEREYRSALSRVENEDE